MSDTDCKPCEERGKNKKEKNLKAFYPFKAFPSYKEIKLYIAELSRLHPNIANLEVIGFTAELSEVYMVKLQKDPCSVRSRKRDVILIDGGIHAREWISISSAMFFINYVILNDYLLDHVNFYVVPVVNVDGYNFSYDNKCYRLWRKNRAKNCQSDIALQGVDLNRNFPIGFAMPGSSDDPSAFNYRGEAPLSEPAAQALSFALNKYEDKIKMYISLHAYGNAILYPWCFTKETIPDCKDLHMCGLVGQQAILKSSQGKRLMRVGSSAVLMKLAAGTSTDYARFVHNIKFCYVMELQGYGSTGFTPDAKHIPQIGYETTLAVLAMTRHVQKFSRQASCQPSQPIVEESSEEEDEEEEEEEDIEPPRKKQKRCSEFHVTAKECN